MQRQLEVDPLGDDPLLGAGADEEKVLLPVVVEAKAAALRPPGRPAGVGRDAGSAARLRGGRLAAAPGDEGTDPLDGLRRHAAAEAQPRHELAVVDDAPAEGRFGHSRGPAEARDLLQQRLVAGATARARRLGEQAGVEGSRGGKGLHPLRR